jgi:hypothetical protein
MSDSQQAAPKRTRRPPSLSNTLTELRDRSERNLAKLNERAARLKAERDQVLAELVTAGHELQRLKLAIGDARDTQRGDVEPDVDLAPLDIVDDRANGAGE